MMILQLFFFHLATPPKYIGCISGIAHLMLEANFGTVEGVGFLLGSSSLPPVQCRHSYLWGLFVTDWW